MTNPLRIVGTLLRALMISSGLLLIASFNPQRDEPLAIIEPGDPLFWGCLLAFPLTLGGAIHLLPSSRWVIRRRRIGVVPPVVTRMVLLVYGAVNGGLVMIAGLNDVIQRATGIRVGLLQGIDLVTDGCLVAFAGFNFIGFWGWLWRKEQRGWHSRVPRDG
jgi:hypothetical protein